MEQHGNVFRSIRTLLRFLIFALITPCFPDFLIAFSSSPLFSLPSLCRFFFVQPSTQCSLLPVSHYRFLPASIPCFFVIYTFMLFPILCFFSAINKVPLENSLSVQPKKKSFCEMKRRRRPKAKQQQNQQGQHDLQAKQSKSGIGVGSRAGRRKRKSMNHKKQQRCTSTAFFPEKE